MMYHSYMMYFVLFPALMGSSQAYHTSIFTRLKHIRSMYYFIRQAFATFKTKTKVLSNRFLSQSLCLYFTLPGEQSSFSLLHPSDTLPNSVSQGFQL